MYDVIYCKYHNKTLKQNSKTRTNVQGMLRTNQRFYLWEPAFSRQITFRQTATGAQCENHTDIEYAEFL